MDTFDLEGIDPQDGENEMRLPKLLKIPSNLRNYLLLALSLAFIVSLILTFSVFSQEIIVKKAVPVATYTEIGEYDYTVYLKNNTLYEKPFLKPGEGVIFKRLVKSVNASFTYTFSCNRSSIITGNYKLIAILSTDLWSKEYTLQASTAFSSEDPSKEFSFHIEFPINFSRFEKILQEINSETGVVARDPRIIYRCIINIEAGKIKDVFTPELNVTLSGEILNIENLYNQRDGVVKELKVIQREDIKASRKQMLALDILLIIIISLLSILSEGISTEDQIFRMIKKKCGDLLVGVKELPAPEKEIKLNSLEDLVKVSDVLGKPIFYRRVGQDHQLAVMDGDTRYTLFLKKRWT